MNPSSTTAWVDITEITKRYLPISRKKARRFVSLYLPSKRLGNRIYVERAQLEKLLSDPDRLQFPLDI